MGFSRRFAVRLAFRSTVLALAIAVLAWLATRAALPATTLLAAGAVIWAAAGVWALVRRTNV